MCISSQPWVHEWQMQMHLPFCFNREKHLLQRTIILTYFFPHTSHCWVSTPPNHPPIL